MHRAPLVLILSALSLPSPEQPPATQPPDDMARQMAQEAARAAPGPEHARLARLVGEWGTVSKLSVPGQPAMESTATATFITTLGGRFLQEEGQSEMMGQSASSVKLWGYNNDSHKYESVWMWTMKTSMLTMKGESKDGGKTIVYAASFDEDKPRPLTVTFKQADDDHFSVTVVGKDEATGVETVMETAYARKK
jgi:hypothetical protein